MGWRKPVVHCEVLRWFAFAGALGYYCNLSLLYWAFVVPPSTAPGQVPQRFPPGMFVHILNPVMHLILSVISANIPQRKGSNVLCRRDENNGNESIGFFL